MVSTLFWSAKSKCSIKYSILQIVQSDQSEQHYSLFTAACRKKNYLIQLEARSLTEVQREMCGGCTSQLWHINQCHQIYGENGGQ